MERVFATVRGFLHAQRIIRGTSRRIKQRRYLKIHRRHSRHAVSWVSILSLLATSFVLAVAPTTPAQAEVPRYAQVEVGFNQSCALDHKGQVWCWGRNTVGGIGDGTATDQGSPTLVDSPGTVFVQIAVGAFHACAIRDNSEVWCWGANWNGQLGVGDTIDRTIPTQVPGLLATQVNAHTLTTCALLTDQSLKCWGSNSRGQLGDGSQDGATSPRTVIGGHHYTNIDLGDETACAIRTDTTLDCWGKTIPVSWVLAISLPQVHPRINRAAWAPPRSLWVNTTAAACATPRPTAGDPIGMVRLA